jgi:integrase
MPQLSVAKIRSANHPGGKTKRPVRLGDGAGLYLQIAPSDTKSWLLRFTRHGKAREMGLGAADPDGRVGISLSQARQLAADARRQLRDGLDPITERDKAALERRKAEERGRDQTFRKAGEGYIAAHRAGWKNAKHAEQWQSTLEAHVFPSMGGMDVANISISDVVGVLKPIWQKIPETASRVRQRIEAILDYAAAPSRKWRSSENPARWRGVLEHELPSISKVRRVRHQPSLPWQQIKAFMTALDDHEGVAAQALKFAILTGCRSGEVRGAVWNEIDLEKATWTIPANRMKAKKLHRVPLSKPAVKVLEAMRPLSFGKSKDLIFPSPTSSSQLSDMALSQLVRGMSSDGLGKDHLPRWRDSENRAVVVHGFRSTFKSWALSTSYPDHLSEIALSHSDRNKVRAAYAREDLLEERRPLMDAWAMLCTSPASKITNIRDARRK